jgi:transcriptional regulator with XRE-family HTH domain
MLKDKLKELRKKNNLTQVEFAKIFTISNGTVGNWESGIRQPDNEMLSKIADYYGVSVDYILEREKSSSSSDELNEREKTMLQMFRSYSPELQERFLALFETALKDKGILQ